MESNGPTISAQVVVGQANRPKQYPGRFCLQHPLVDETGEKDSCAWGDLRFVNQSDTVRENSSVFIPV
jgi:hypothetical protein